MKYENVNHALKHSNSDKATGWHQYGVIYNWIFNSLHLKLQTKLNILEIGVSLYGAGSMTAIANLDVCNLFVGIDIKDYAAPIPEKCVFYKMDAYCKETVNLLRETHEGFDIIIDDGSHLPEHQQWVLDNYDRLLSAHGILIIEDVWDKSYLKDLTDVYIVHDTFNAISDDSVLILKGDIW